MNTDAGDLLQHGTVAGDLRSFQQYLTGFDSALGQLGDQISEAEQKSKCILHDIEPVVPQG